MHSAYTEVHQMIIFFFIVLYTLILISCACILTNRLTSTIYLIEYLIVRASEWHAVIYIYIYIYMCVCVCVCVCKERERERAESYSVMPRYKYKSNHF